MQVFLAFLLASWRFNFHFPIDMMAPEPIMPIPHYPVLPQSFDEAFARKEARLRRNWLCVFILGGAAFGLFLCGVGHIGGHREWAVMRSPHDFSAEGFARWSADVDAELRTGSRGNGGYEDSIWGVPIQRVVDRGRLGMDVKSLCGVPGSIAIPAFYLAFAVAFGWLGQVLFHKAWVRSTA